MTSITVLGASGFAGKHITQEALSRGHQVTTVSRSGAQLEGARNIRGSVLDEHVLNQAIEGADVVIGSLSPRGDMAGKVRGAYGSVNAKLSGSGTRFIVVGGFGSLRAPDGTRFVESPDFPEDYRAEAEELFGVLTDLQSSTDLDWTYVSPAQAFGSYIPNQERTGVYRSSTDEPLFDEHGVSTISGADFAIAVLDEIEADRHRRMHLSFAY